MREGISKAKKTKEFYFFFLLVSLLILADRLLKIIFFRIKPFMEFKIASFTVFSIKTIENYGAAFGILANNQIVLIIVPVIVIILILANLNRILNGKRYRIPTLLILSGAIGNLIDRMIYGKVLDFISLFSIPYFNLADVMITIGVFIIVFMEVFPLRLKQKLNKHSKK